jgi:hypothetical protein
MPPATKNQNPEQIARDQIDVKLAEPDIIENIESGLASFRAVLTGLKKVR